MGETVLISMAEQEKITDDLGQSRGESVKKEYQQDATI